MDFKIKEAREKAGYSQKELAEIIGVAPNTFHGYESGKHDPKSDLLIKIANACKVTTDFLLGTSDLMAPTREKENAPLYSSEALRLAVDYDSHMDNRGRETVRSVADLEVARYKATPPVVEEPQEFPKKVVKMPKPKKIGKMVEIKVYDEPAAAGLGNYLDDPDYHMEYYPEDVIHPYTDFGVLIDGDSMEPKVHDGGTVFVESMQSIEPGQIGIFVLNGKSYCKKLAVDHEKRQIRLVSINKEYEDIIVGEFDSFRTLGRVRGQYTKGQSNDIFGW